MMSNPYPSDVQAQLARERNRIAADRSLLSFIRNSLLLISTGVGIDQVAIALSPDQIATFGFTHLFSLFLTGLGTVSLLLACRDYQQEIKRLNQPEYYFTPRYSLGRATGYAIIATGLLALGWVIFRVIS
jgi:putative membrane protein